MIIGLVEMIKALTFVLKNLNRIPCAGELTVVERTSFAEGGETSSSEGGVGTTEPKLIVHGERAETTIQIKEN